MQQSFENSLKTIYNNFLVKLDAIKVSFVDKIKAIKNKEDNQAVEDIRNKIKSL